MNYRHIYHAGNFGDVFKHCILVLLLEKLRQKDNPFCYVDTHAGLGIYDLQSDPAQKTLEYLGGISRILDYVYGEVPSEITPYLALIKKMNKTAVTGALTGNNIRFYPGSPYLARSLLRPDDHMILMELHQEDVLSLKKLFTRDKQVAVHHYDGYQGLKAFLPPHERRGLVLIDPAFEQKNEFELVLSALEVAMARWQNGIYAIWYPIKDFTLVHKFLDALSKMDIQYLISEMTIGKNTIGKKPVLKEFIGCGMVIVNPPWQFDVILKKVLSWLWQILSPNQEGYIKVTNKYLGNIKRSRIL